MENEDQELECETPTPDRRRKFAEQRKNNKVDMTESGGGGSSTSVVTTASSSSSSSSSSSGIVVAVLTQYAHWHFEACPLHLNHFELGTHSLCAFPLSYRRN